MKLFSKSEALVVITTLVVVAIVSFFNFRVALRRARDYQRKEDVRNIAQALETYHSDFGFLPLSSDDGRILACVDEKTREMFGLQTDNLKSFIQNYVLGLSDAKETFSFIPCRWGEDALEDVSDPSYPDYLSRIPVDPQNDYGVKYRYISNGRRFQILAHLEGIDEAEYDPAIVARGVMCGTQVCNFGRHFNSPLDKSVEQYENELRELEEQNNAQK